MLSLLGVYYHFRLTSVHYVKSTKKSWQGADPPPLFGNAKIFRAPISLTPSLMAPCISYLIVRVFVSMCTFGACVILCAVSLCVSKQLSRQCTNAALYAKSAISAHCGQNLCSLWPKWASIRLTFVSLPPKGSAKQKHLVPR